MPHRQLRLLMVLVYVAYAFAYRIMMMPSGTRDPHVPDLAGDLTMNYDVANEIIGARSIIDGSFSMYATKYSKDLVPPEGVSISYPPLTAYLQVPFVFIGQRLGLKPFGMPMFMICGLPYIALGALCALQAGVVLRKALRVEDEAVVTATVFLLLFSSLMFWVVTYSARFEFVAVLFLLLAMTALAAGRYGRAGISLGLALMTKQVTLPAVLVFVVVVFVGAARKRIPFRNAARLTAAVPIPFTMLIPFLIACPHGVWDGFFTALKLLPIMEVSAVNAVLQLGKLVLEERVLAQFLRTYSNSIILALCAGFVLLMAWKHDVRPGTDRFCALVALASLFFPVLAK